MKGDSNEGSAADLKEAARSKELRASLQRHTQQTITPSNAHLSAHTKLTADRTVSREADTVGCLISNSF